MIDRSPETRATIGPAGRAQGVIGHAAARGGAVIVAPVKAPAAARAVRERTVMTMRERSAASGVSTNTLVRLERGEDARISTVRRLAAALGVESIALTQAEQQPVHDEAA